ncbi:hypothetical protein [Halobacillus amylolyticus]|uniref:DUF4355 domain-containing protein n=1 Tax=Halobacillus amylolyticus TaxID=2932259 RepID=A0ABY4HBY8_9BACI|nr:hypothetical protein [Halobacillus amylolyticus]UOR12182.1 hypothetical protein MUO15_01190 [Halobacillus amylolyticus]
MSEENKEQVFTQEQMEEFKSNLYQDWQKEHLTPVQTELEEVKGKLPVEKTEQELALEQREKDLFKREVGAELQSAGLGQFKDIVKVSDEQELASTIKQLNKAVNDMKIDNSYQPNSHKQTDALTVAKKNGDTQGMLKSIFGFNS